MSIENRCVLCGEQLNARLGCRCNRAPRTDRAVDRRSWADEDSEEDIAKACESPSYESDTRKRLDMGPRRARKRGGDDFNNGFLLE